MLRMLAPVVVTIAALHAQPPGPFDDAQAIAAARRTIVHRLDRSLPAVRFDDWLRELAGADASIGWNVTNCGEPFGDPVDRAQDPACAHADATLADRRRLSLLLLVGTVEVGLHDAVRFHRGSLTDVNGAVTPTACIAQASTLLAGNRVRVASILSGGPNRIAGEMPLLPEKARRAGVTGSVIVQIRIDRTGAVSAVRTLRGQPLLNRAAEDAVAQWTYEPWVFNCEPTEIVLSVAVTFRQP